MPHSASKPSSMEGPATCFATTHWSVVLRAGEGQSGSLLALEQLCQTYWYPLYAYVRRQGQKPEDAQDLTQAFFARFLEKDFVRLANPERGRFRSFLLTSLKHFLVNEWEKGQTVRRGGRQSFLSLDEHAPETRYLAEASHSPLTPDQLYDQRWAVEMLNKVLSVLREEYLGAGKASLFENLKGHALGESAMEGYNALAERLHMSEGSLRVAAFRLRERYQALLRAEIAHTVTTPDEVEGELRYLIAALRE